MKVDDFDSKIGIKGYLYSIKRQKAIIESLEDFIVEEVLHGKIAEAIKVQRVGRVKGKGLYRFVLVKKGIGTREAIRLVAHDLGIKQTSFKVCGFKDAYGLTAQFVTVYGNILANRIKKRKFLWIRDFIPYHRHLNRYSHEGNRFTIRLKASSNVITSLIDFLKSADLIQYSRKNSSIQVDTWPFPNFYTFQRFGSTRPVAHRIGLAILKKDYKKAIEIFLFAPSKLESKRLQRARYAYKKSPDPVSVSKLFPASTLERTVLKYLSKYPKNYKGAIKKLPSMVRVMWIQAAQSYIFNKLLSIKLSDLRENVVHRIIKEPELVRQLDDNILPLVGDSTELSNPVWGSELKRILAELGISPYNFDTEFGSFPGALRPGITLARNVIIQQREDDHVILQFMFPPGAYAYAFLREFLVILREKTAK